MRVRSAWALVVQMAALLAFGAAGRAAYRELFLDVPGVHMARWPLPWSTSKAAVLSILLSAAVGIFATLVSAIAREGRARLVSSWSAGFAMLALLTAYVVWGAEFFRHAGRFG